MKKLLCFIISLVLILSLGLAGCGLIENSISENPPIKSGKLYFALNGNEYTVTADVSLISTKVTVPSEYDGKPVTKIGANAFENAEELICVILPSSIKYVAENAFNKCYELKYILCDGSVAEFSQMTCEDLSISDKTYFYSAVKPVAEGKFWTRYKGEICLWKGGDAPYSIDAEIAPFGGIIGA